MAFIKSMLSGSSAIVVEGNLQSARLSNFREGVDTAFTKNALSGSSAIVVRGNLQITHPSVHLYVHNTEVCNVFWRPPVLWGRGNSGAQAVLSAPTLIIPDGLGTRLAWGDVAMAICS